ncbi:D-aminoacyl-tRNA deacylase isoform X4 [Mangifera indica]|uniref:D-aminoacyl-tRNA deacylase isoform X4 n=1 Tax=Mangifera indica TaxID=29780 RepID=UPI001CF9CD51|nr:D-aminoacyl-tRNA deacylase isoform X4 [Mangifera indica]
MYAIPLLPSFVLRITKPKRTRLHRQKLQIRAMRAVVQRVTSASVEADGRIVSEIGPGLLVLVGLHESDTDSDADYICRKVLNMRLFPNENTGKGWDFNKNYEVLLKARPFYDSLVEKFRKTYNVDAVKDGVFGAMMKVNLVNDGPVTMQLDSSLSSKNRNEAEGE